MSQKNKLQKFSELREFTNVLENFERLSSVLVKGEEEDVVYNGKWAQAQFGNDHPIVLELACGKGEYTLELARMYPEKNFIGVDIKGNRIWKGASIALEEKLKNVAFLRTRIELIDKYFNEGEIDEIWITFPDPYPRKSKSGKRLTSPRFIELYRKILRKKGLLRFKTDAEALFEWTVDTFSEDKKIKIHDLRRDLYSKDVPEPELNIKTFYERMHLAEGREIFYLAATIHKKKD
jgi:tRNA (guanine-N7-)-methyltransferase